MGLSVPETPRAKTCSPCFFKTWSETNECFTKHAWSDCRPDGQVWLKFFFTRSPTWFSQTYFRGNYWINHGKNGNSQSMSKRVSIVRQTLKATGTYTWVIRIDTMFGFVTSPLLLHRVTSSFQDFVTMNDSYTRVGLMMTGIVTNFRECDAQLTRTCNAQNTYYCV